MTHEDDSYLYEPEFSLKKLLAQRVNDLKYILSFKKILATGLIIGALIGASIAWYKAPTYTARLTFVVDDSKSIGGGGGLSALAGLAGLDLGSLSGASGVLAGDNVEELIKSRKLMQQTLLTAYDSTQTLADKYASVYKLSKKWRKYSPDDKIIRFPLNGFKATRLQDSLLHEMIDLILDNNFGIAKTDKKLSFFEVNTTMKDEKLAQLFCRRMIDQSTSFFISTKTKRLRNNVERLQHIADSVQHLLNHKTYTSAAADQNVIDLNPAYSGANADIEVKQRDKTLLSAVYSETVKNLEASKTMLAQETPTVQIVDEPDLPLKKNSLKYYITIPTGIVITEILFCVFILIRRKD
ncbi:hypothetical protein ACFS5N_15380 [Mucilaginibacter ximonensis]|uniref:Subunit length determinant protein n=1 Tax=Mucilaginibacter ximonensis TaxID=538021 RepID=A0ABW5YEZ8_9SPHI